MERCKKTEEIIESHGFTKYDPEIKSAGFHFSWDYREYDEEQKIKDEKDEFDYRYGYLIRIDYIGPSTDPFHFNFGVWWDQNISLAKLTADAFYSFDSELCRKKRYVTHYEFA